jgi:protein SCO1/2
LRRGRPLKLSDLRGKVVALTFIYTRCPLPDFCPMLDTKFARASEQASAVTKRASRLVFLSVSFDPEHDTPEALARHARARGAKPPLWTFAVATHPELARVGRPLGLVYGPGRDEVLHNLVVAVIGPDGRLVRIETGAAARAWEPGDLLKTMYSQIPRSHE